MVSEYRTSSGCVRLLDGGGRHNMYAGGEWAAQKALTVPAADGGWPRTNTSVRMRTYGCTNDSDMNAAAGIGLHGLRAAAMGGFRATAAHMYPTSP